MQLVGIRRGPARVVHRVDHGDGGVPRVVATVARGGAHGGGDRAAAAAGAAGGVATGTWRAGRDTGTTVELLVGTDGEVLEVVATLRDGVVDDDPAPVVSRTAGRPVFDRTTWADPRRRAEPIAVTAQRTPFDELELRVGPGRGVAARACWVAGNLQVLVTADGRVRGVRIGPLTRQEWAVLTAG